MLAADIRSVRDVVVKSDLGLCEAAGVVCGVEAELVSDDFFTMLPGVPDRLAARFCALWDFFEAISGVEVGDFGDSWGSALEAERLLSYLANVAEGLTWG